MTRPAIRLGAAVIAGGLALAMAASGQAQPAPGAGGPPAAHAGHGWDPAQMRERMQARRQQRLQTVHDALGLRPDQEGAWQAYVADTRPADRQGDRDKRRGEEPRPQLTTPERLDRMSRRLDEMKARLDRRAAAVKKFYAVLDARQQKTFDALQASGMGGRMGWRMHGRGGGRSDGPERG